MIKAIQDSMEGGEWHDLEALKDGTVFVNIFAEGKQ